MMFARPARRFNLWHRDSTGREVIAARDLSEEDAIDFARAFNFRTEMLEALRLAVDFIEKMAPELVVPKKVLDAIALGSGGEGHTEKAYRAGAPPETAQMSLVSTVEIVTALETIERLAARISIGLRSRDPLDSIAVFGLTGTAEAIGAGARETIAVMQRTVLASTDPHAVEGLELAVEGLKRSIRDDFDASREAFRDALTHD